MDLTVHDAARLLNISENTVYRWIRAGVLPTHRVHGHYRFNRVELQEWADSRQHRVSPELLAPSESASEFSSLRSALQRGGIHHDVPGQTPAEVFHAVSRLPGIPADMDRDQLVQLLTGRETLASTGIGNGVAIPHPRDPLVVGVDAPVVLLCFLKAPVDFRAIDGKPVRILFTILTPSIRSHLQVLSKLAFALHDTAFKGLLDRSSPKEPILERLNAIEGTSSPLPAELGVHP